MKLKSGSVYWSQNDRAALHFPALQNDARCEIAVMGGGVTGALAAHALAAAGADVVVVDRRQPAQGSTVASTGLLQYEIDTPLVELAELIGPNFAKRAYRRALQTLDDFEHLTQILGDDCGLTPRKSLYLAARESDVELFRNECAARRAIGIEVDFLDSKAVAREFHFDRPAALLSKHAAEIDPYRLTLNLHQRSLDYGTQIFGGTQIERYEPHADGVRLTTAHGHTIDAGKVVFATGYETARFIKRPLFKLKSTFALITQPLAPFPDWPGRCLIWEHNKPYFYARATRDGRAMIGGEDIDDADPAVRDELLPKKTRALLDKFNSLFPAAHATSSSAWAGTFAETNDGLPYIGTLSDFPHGYFALGYGGNGITFSLIASEIIRDSYLGKLNPDAELFGFDRASAKVWRSS